MRDWALILGGANCLWDDISVLRGLGIWPPTVRIAVNAAGYAYHGRIDHWVTLHPENLDAWIKRRPAECNSNFETWCQIELGRIKKMNPYPVDHKIKHWGAGSSGLFGVTVADHLGFERRILCGVPMDTQGNVSGATHWPQYDVDLHRGGWIKKLAEIKDTTRSMSGWTKELLGEPTMEWLRE